MSLLKSSPLIKAPLSSRNAPFVMRRLFVDGRKHPAGISFMMIAFINGCLKAKPAPSTGGEP